MPESYSYYFTFALDFVVYFLCLHLLFLLLFTGRKNTYSLPLGEE